MLLRHHGCEADKSVCRHEGACRARARGVASHYDSKPSGVIWRELQGLLAIEGDNLTVAIVRWDAARAKALDKALAAKRATSEVIAARTPHDVATMQRTLMARAPMKSRAFVNWGSIETHLLRAGDGTAADCIGVAKFTTLVGGELEADERTNGDDHSAQATARARMIRQIQRR